MNEKSILIGRITQVAYVGGVERPPVVQDIWYDDRHGWHTDDPASRRVRDRRLTNTKAELDRVTLKAMAKRIAGLEKLATYMDAMTPSGSCTTYRVELWDGTTQALHPFYYHGLPAPAIHNALCESLKVAQMIQRLKDEMSARQLKVYNFEQVWFELRMVLTQHIADRSQYRNAGQPGGEVANNLFGLLGEYVMQADSTDIQDIHGDALLTLLYQAGYIRNEHVGKPMAEFVDDLHMRRAYYTGQIIDYLERGGRPHQSIGFCILKRGMHKE